MRVTACKENISLKWAYFDIQYHRDPKPECLKSHTNSRSSDAPNG